MVSDFWLTLHQRCAAHQLDPKSGPWRYRHQHFTVAEHLLTGHGYFVAASRWHAWGTHRDQQMQQAFDYTAALFSPLCQPL